MDRTSIPADTLDQVNTQDKTSELLAALAHEIRNPLASVQGCAMTLAARRGELDEDVVDALINVVVSQSKRMDWIVRAVAALAGAQGARAIGTVDSAAVARDAGAVAGVEVDAHDSFVFEADERRVRLALEALLIALRSGTTGLRARLNSGGKRLELASEAKDLGGERGWKLDLADRLLGEEGCALSITPTADGTKAVVHFTREAR